VITLLLAALLLTALIVGVMAPALAWLDAREREIASGETRPVRDPALGPELERVLAPFTDAAAALARAERIDPAAAPVGSRLASLVGWLAVAALFAVIPFAGRYAIVHGEVTLALADPEWGLSLALVAPSLAILGVALAGVSAGGPEALLGGVRAATQGAASLLALAASLLPMLVLYGTLRPIEAGLWQDAVIPFGRVLDVVGVRAPAWLPAGAGLPAWGALLNPPALVCFFVASMMLVAKPPFDGPFGRDLTGGVSTAVSGARAAILDLTGRAWTLAFGCLTVLLFLGGWSLPWIPQATLTSWIEPHLGAGFAAGVAAAVHLASFLVKLALVVRVQVWLRWSLPAWRDDQVRALCLRGLVPIALLDVLVTLAVLAALGEGAS